MVLLVKYMRHYIKEKERSREKAFIYMILVPTLVLYTTPPTIPLRTPIIPPLYWIAYIILLF